MKVTINPTNIVIKREAPDPKFYGVVNAAGESKLLHHLKKYLNAKGYDLIKKRMHKDGHMVADMQQYLRTRKINAKTIMIYNGRWQIEGAEVAWNAGHNTTFILETNK